MKILGELEQRYSELEELALWSQEYLSQSKRAPRAPSAQHIARDKAFSKWMDSFFLESPSLSCSAACRLSEKVARVGVPREVVAMQNPTRCSMLILHMGRMEDDVLAEDLAECFVSEGEVEATADDVVAVACNLRIASGIHEFARAGSRLTGLDLSHLADVVRAAVLVRQMIEDPRLLRHLSDWNWGHALALFMDARQYRGVRRHAARIGGREGMDELTPEDPPFMKFPVEAQENEGFSYFAVEWILASVDARKSAGFEDGWTYARKFLPLFKDKSLQSWLQDHGRSLASGRGVR